MLTTGCCPQCGIQADSGPVRLVQDSCGHKKCRGCLVNDETGCLLCSYAPVYLELRSSGSRPVPGPSAGAQFAPAVLPETDFTSSTDVTPSTSSYDESIPVNLQKSEALTGSSYLKEDVRGPEKEEGSANTLSDESKDVNLSKRPPSFGLKEHIIFTPGNPPKYSCKKCNKSYNNRKAARYHNYCGAPNTEKPHTCSECGQGFVTKGHLEYHMKSHTGSLPFMCKTCGKGFKQLSKLHRHCKSHEGAPDKPFNCEMCDKTFSTKQILKDHMLSHSKGHYVMCPICNKKLSSQSCLRKHKKLHAEPIYQCKDCGKKFPVKWSLQVHMRTHQRERKFKCKECPRAFKIHSDLKRHALVHQEDGEWECKHCHLIFRRRDNLVRHFKNLHPESPLAVSTRQTDDKESEVQQEKPNLGGEKCSPISSVCQAVSVIRIVPAIHKTDDVSARPSSVLQDASDLPNTMNFDTTRKASELQEENLDNIHFPCNPNISVTSQGTDQNLHRESVVCHSDARGVVHYGSSSRESGYDEGVIRTRTEKTSEQESALRDQFQFCEPCPHEAGHEENSPQNNLVSRPRVIVAKKTCL